MVNAAALALFSPSRLFAHLHGQMLRLLVGTKKGNTSQQDTSPERRVSRPFKGWSTPANTEFSAQQQ